MLSLRINAVKRCALCALFAVELLAVIEDITEMRTHFQRVDLDAGTHRLILCELEIEFPVIVHHKHVIGRADLAAAAEEVHCGFNAVVLGILLILSGLLYDEQAAACENDTCCRSCKGGCNTLQNRLFGAHTDIVLSAVRMPCVRKAARFAADRLCVTDALLYNRAGLSVPFDGRRLCGVDIFIRDIFNRIEKIGRLHKNPSCSRCFRSFWRVRISVTETFDFEMPRSSAMSSIGQTYQ